MKPGSFGGPLKGIGSLSLRPGESPTRPLRASCDEADPHVMKPGSFEGPPMGPSRASCDAARII